jgi:3-deoxy-manno-octulosonate cytidylyltransferase (CMP-KDO synthetase)
MNEPTFAVVLPARYQSTRFPGKPLAMIAGRPLIEWVHRRARAIGGAAAVVVATDDARIAEVVRGFGGEAVMTRADHATGTDRVAEVAESLDVDVVVNLQGDEPVFDPAVVEAMVAALARDPELDVVTACHPIRDGAEFASPHVVKVVVDARDRALYFSRAPIPHGALVGGGALRHVGVYAYRREALRRLASLPRTPLERSEGLEQLRALENGMTIGVVRTAVPTVGVDVPDDIKSVEKAMGTTYTTSSSSTAQAIHSKDGTS